MARMLSSSRVMALSAAMLFLLLLTGGVSAFTTYQAKIPNGGNVVRNGAAWPGVGHEVSGGGGARNTFGNAFRDAGRVYNYDICRADYDADGWTTGAELGDPACLWSEGVSANRTTDITHPSYSDSVPANPIDVEITGFLADRECVNAGTAADGAVMTTNPWMHTVKCALMPPCVVSGYTVLIQKVISSQSLSGPYSSLINNTDVSSFTATGSPQFEWMMNLTTTSNAKAVEFLNTLPFSRRNILVKIVGTLHSNHMLEITSLEDLTPASATIVRFTGYIADRECVDAGVAADGANMRHEPYKHTTKCALMEPCVASGYTLLMDDNATESFSNDTSPLLNMKAWDLAVFDASTSAYGQRSFSPVFNISKETQYKIENWLKMLADNRPNLLVAIEGVIGADGVTFDLATITDLSPETLVKVTIVGYLADRQCVDAGTAADGADMVLSPFRHTAKCALMPPCIASGYTILVPQNYTGTTAMPYPTDAEVYQPLPAFYSDQAAQFDYANWNSADYKFEHALNLSTSANEMAVKWLERWPSYKNNLLVKLVGVLDADGNITSATISTVADKVMYNGYLADRLCADNIIAMDGSNMTHDPWNHTRKCALMPPCKASGYLLMMDTNTTHSYTDPDWSPLVNLTSPDEVNAFVPDAGHVFKRGYNFTESGDEAAVEFLEHLQPKRKNILVQAKGSLLDNDTYAVEHIMDKVERVIIYGYLADRQCVDAGTAADGANMVTAPWKHTVKCALMPPCIASGYTILRDRTLEAAHYASIVNRSAHTVENYSPVDSSGTGFIPKFMPFVNLTTQGNAKAVEYLKFFPMERNNLLVKVTGRWVWSSTANAMHLDVEIIEDYTPMSVAWSGFVVCANYNLFNTMQPWLLDAATAGLNQCGGAGYMLISDTNTTHSWTSVSSSTTSPLLSESLNYTDVTNWKPDMNHTYMSMWNFTSTWDSHMSRYFTNAAPGRNNLLFHFQGVLNVDPNDSTMRHLDIVEMKDLTSHNALYEGYLADRLCVDGRWAADGADMWYAPWNHTVKCALMPPCIDSGYTLLVDTNTTHSYTNPRWSPLVNMLDTEVAQFTPEAGHMFTPKYNLSESGDEHAVTFLKKLPANRNNLLVGVAGGVNLSVTDTTVFNTDKIIDLSPRSTRIVTLTGFLADILCVDGRYAADGADMLLAPWNHTAKCALMPPCIASGYTILVDRNTTWSLSGMSSPLINLTISEVQGWRVPAGDDSHQFYSAYNLTAEANSQAVAWLRTLPKERNNLLVKITGTLDSAGHLNIDMMEDLSPETSKPIVVIGFLADVLCYERRWAFDGTDMWTQPWKHSVKCNLMPICIASGYSVLVDTHSNSLTTMTSVLINMKASDVTNFAPTDGTHRFVAQYNLTANGNTLAAAWLKDLPLTRNNVLVKITGWIVNGKLEVKMIEDLSFLTAPAIKVEGYLADRLCVGGRFAADGADMLYSPWNHSVKCALMPPCIASGYTILTDHNGTHSWSSSSSPLANLALADVQGFDDKPAEHSFHPTWNLTDAGNEVAVNFLQTQPMFRTNLLVEAWATVENPNITNGTIDVYSINDLSPNTVPIITIVGFVADILCVNNRWSLAGTDMRHHPWRHSVKCNLMPQCIQSGYTLLTDLDTTSGSLSANTSVLVNRTIKELATWAPSAAHTFVSTYNFTEAGNQKLVEWFRDLIPNRNNLLVELRGAVEPVTGLFDIVEIIDLSAKTAPDVSTIGKGFQGMFTGLGRGGILNSNSSNISTWTTVSGQKICNYDGVGYTCDFSAVVPPMQGSFDIKALPSGISKLLIKRQGITGAFDLSPPFLGDNAFLTELSIAQNSLTGAIDPSTFTTMSSFLTHVDLSFNQLSGLVTLTSLPSTAAEMINIAGNNFTTGDLQINSNIPSEIHLVLDQIGSPTARRLTGYSPNNFATVSYVCGNAVPTVELLLNNGSYVTIPNGTDIPMHCAGCTAGEVYNLADANCGSAAGTPIPGGNVSDGMVMLDPKITANDSWCNEGCVGMIVGIIVFILVLVIIAVVIRLCCKPKPMKSLDSQDGYGGSSRPPTYARNNQDFSQM